MCPGHLGNTVTIGYPSTRVETHDLAGSHTDTHHTAHDLFGVYDSPYNYRHCYSRSQSYSGSNATSCPDRHAAFFGNSFG